MIVQLAGTKRSAEVFESARNRSHRLRLGQPRASSGASGTLRACPEPLSGAGRPDAGSPCSEQQVAEVEWLLRSLAGCGGAEMR
ncbi:hypothetical protein AV530_012082 [Patagioenas fasciata monilis]|uniref:Uncharacterized protein n=1 Tax=Patagioenas fasciata monilis TaxID=372326 RepID=A0A1V4JUZ5_PATFA|nr:hypothetical protein AV530_012082 [Patagioenas fasciata monilis]